MNDVTKLCARLITNKALKDFFSLVLSFGNQLNTGHSYLSNASAFKIDCLNDLPRLKSGLDQTDMLENLIRAFNTQTRSPFIASIGEHFQLVEVANLNLLGLMSACKKFLRGTKSLEEGYFGERYMRIVEKFLMEKGEGM